MPTQSTTQPEPWHPTRLPRLPGETAIEHALRACDMAGTFSRETREQGFAIGTRARSLSFRFGHAFAAKFASRAYQRLRDGWTPPARFLTREAA